MYIKLQGRHARCQVKGFPLSFTIIDIGKLSGLQSQTVCCFIMTSCLIVTSLEFGLRRVEGKNNFPFD